MGSTALFAQNLPSKPSLFPFLKKPSPTYIKSQKQVLDKFNSDSLNYSYQISYFFPEQNVKLVVASSLESELTGLTIFKNGTVVGNQTYKFLSQNIDCPEFAEATDLNADGNLDFIVRLRNHNGSELAQQVHTNFYIIQKPERNTFFVSIVGSFFPWKEYDLNADGKYEAINVDLVGIAGKNAFNLNVFSFNPEKNNWTNVGKELGYPKFFKYTPEKGVWPVKKQKVRKATVPFYRTTLPFVSFREK
jgi:hypothetical protein